jgi:hypothetical protein
MTAPASKSSDPRVRAGKGVRRVRCRPKVEHYVALDIRKLQDYGLLTKDLKKRVAQAGLSWATLRRAKGALGAKARKSGMEGGWTWELPAKELEDARAGE